MNKTVCLAALLLFLLPPASALAVTPEVKIADSPLAGSRAGKVEPNMVLNLSVEFPAVGLAYRGDSGAYRRSTEYIGYFNPLKCYVYQGDSRSPGEDDHFRIARDAHPSTHECGGDAFSGNFMNWAASSAIDMLRYALTGGDRIVDTPGVTILQRAFLADGFYAHPWLFPRRKVAAGGNGSAPGDVTPFKTDTLYVVSCRNRILFSDRSSGLERVSEADGYCTSVFDGKGEPPPKAIDKRLGEYLARVKVCDDHEGAARTDLCEKYGSRYKPVGQLQRKAGRLRVAAMGYLLDNSEARYGGVLRSAMKYVGGTKRAAPDFTEAANDRPEWDPQTGVLYNNPDEPTDRNSKTVNSGVINYLNKFGRSGIYKTYDPVGELYYEAVRYLQGKPSTPEATAGMTEAMKDGFPVIANRDDPVLAACQQNYIVTIADVYSHWDRYLPGNDRTTFGGQQDAHDNSRSVEAAIPGKTPELDVRTWTRKVGEMENDAARTFGNPDPRPHLADLHRMDTGSDGHGTYYMAGLAYWANTNDIRLDKPTRIKSFVIDVDEGGNGRIDSGTRTIPVPDSQLYLAAKYGGFDDAAGTGNPFARDRSWNSTICRNNGSDGSEAFGHYFLASQPAQLVRAIGRVFNNGGRASGTISGISVSASRISSDAIFAYVPVFDPSSWCGSLRKLELTHDGKGRIAIAHDAEWDAGSILSGGEGSVPVPAPDARRIYTAIVGDRGISTATEFIWEKLSGSQQGLLKASPADGRDDGLGEQRVQFLRGDRSREADRPNGVFRTRGSVLGDIVNSSPVFAGAPAPRVQGDDYQAFFKRYEKRAHAVYVGANDGMLHAFNAKDGSELFAYVPNALMAHLNRLTAPDYVHRPYVDGRLAVAEAQVGRQWRTVLASGMGGGAQGVFALDVTDPADFASGKGVLWEFTDANDPDMGNVTGTPAIARFSTGSIGGTGGTGDVAEYKYFVVVSSGLNNYKDDGTGRFNTDAAGVLFLLSLDKKQSDPWTLGNNYYKFRVPATDSRLPNGLGPPALVAGSNGGVRRVYAGDLQGNVWRFEFSGMAPWTNALRGDKPKPLFTAMDDNSVRQPITMQPRVVFGPGGGYVVLVGTGKFVEDADTRQFRTQSFYGIHDANDELPAVTGRSELAVRSLVREGEAYRLAGDALAYGSNGDGKKGWYFDFPDSRTTGERAVTEAQLANGRLFFNSLIPAADACGAGGGQSYILDALSGLPPDGVLTGQRSKLGMLASPIVVQTGAEVGSRNAVGSRVVSKRYASVNFGTDDAGPADSPAVAVPAGRISWREIFNWKERRDANR